MSKKNTTFDRLMSDAASLRGSSGASTSSGRSSMRKSSYNPGYYDSRKQAEDAQKKAEEAKRKTSLRGVWDTFINWANEADPYAGYMTDELTTSNFEQAGYKDDRGSLFDRYRANKEEDYDAWLKNNQAQVQYASEQENDKILFDMYSTGSQSLQELVDTMQGIYDKAAASGKPQAEDFKQKLDYYKGLLDQENEYTRQQGVLSDWDKTHTGTDTDFQRYLTTTAQYGEESGDTLQQRYEDLQEKVNDPSLSSSELEGYKQALADMDERYGYFLNQHGMYDGITMQSGASLAEAQARYDAAQEKLTQLQHQSEQPVVDYESDPDYVEAMEAARAWADENKDEWTPEYREEYLKQKEAEARRLANIDAGASATKSPVSDEELRAAAQELEDAKLILDHAQSMYGSEATRAAGYAAMFDSTDYDATVERGKQMHDDMIAGLNGAPTQAAQEERDAYWQEQYDDAIADGMGEQDAKDLADYLTNSYMTSRQAEASRWDPEFYDERHQPNENWTDQNYKDYYWTLATYGEDAAAQVARNINGAQVADAWYKDKMLHDQYFAERHPAIATALARVGNLTGTYDWAKMVAEGTYNEGDVLYSLYEGASRDAEVYTATIAGLLADKGNLNDLIQAMTGGHMDFNVPYLGEKNLGDLYQATASSLDSTIAYLVSGGNPMLMNSIFFGASAANEMRSAIESGTDFDKAVWGSAASGFSEAFGETVSIEFLFSKSGAEWLKTGIMAMLAPQMVEGSEEIVTGLVDRYFDDLINGVNSKFNTLYLGYLHSGMSEAEAKKAAETDYWKQLGDQAFMAMVSIGETQAGHLLISAPGAMVNYNAENNGGITPEMMLDAASIQGGKAGQLADKYRGRYESKGRMSNLAASKLMDSLTKGTMSAAQARTFFEAAAGGLRSAVETSGAQAQAAADAQAAQATAQNAEQEGSAGEAAAYARQVRADEESRQAVEQNAEQEGFAAEAAALGRQRRADAESGQAFEQNREQEGSAAEAAAYARQMRADAESEAAIEQNREQEASGTEAAEYARKQAEEKARQEAAQRGAEAYQDEQDEILKASQREEEKETKSEEDQAAEDMKTVKDVLDWLDNPSKKAPIEGLTQEKAEEIIQDLGTKLGADLSNKPGLKGKASTKTQTASARVRQVLDALERIDNRNSERERADMRESAEHTATKEQAAKLDDGSTIRAAKYDGKTGTVTVTVEDSNGNEKTVDRSELTGEAAELFDTLEANLGTAQAVEAFNSMEAGQDALYYGTDFRLMRNLGQRGANFETVFKSSGGVLTRAQARQAYDLGRGMTNREGGTPIRSFTMKGTGNVSLDGGELNGQTLHAVSDKNALYNSSDYKLVKKIAQALEVDVVFFESQSDAEGRLVGANGAYQNGVIYLDVNAGMSYKGVGERMFFTTLSHELTHFIKDNAPERYNELQDKISQYLMDNKHVDFNGLVRSKMARASDRLTYDGAVEEVIADACETMLRDSKAVMELAQERPKLFKTMRQYLDRFANRILARHAEAKALQPVIKDIQKVWDNALKEAVANRTEGEVKEFTKDGKTTAVANDDNAMLSIRTYEDGGQEALHSFLNKRVKDGALTENEASQIRTQVDELYKICKEYDNGKYAPFSAWSNASVVTYDGRPVFSVVKANGEYKLNLDFSLVCKKRRTLDAVFNEMIAQGIMDDFDMVQESIAKINDIIRDNGFETACGLCFVDSKRYRQGMIADMFVKMYNEQVFSLVRKDDGQKMDYFNYGGDKTIQNTGAGIDTLADDELNWTKVDSILEKEKPTTVRWKIANYLKNNPSARRLVRRGDFMSTAGFDALKAQNPDLLSLYNSKKGAGGPKAAQSDVQYLNEIINSAAFNPKAAYEVGGVRIQSFSDYVGRLVFDYIQMTADLAAKQLPAHSYTKEYMFAQQFGLTGIKINMSLVPEVVKGGIAAGLDANGNYTWKDGQSFGSTVYDNKGKRMTAAEGFELAKRIQNAEGYSKNCGTIAVGVSDQHIRKMLDDPEIRMIIPYHKSSLNHIVAAMMNIDKYTDYTLRQNTRERKNGKLVNISRSNEFNFNEALQRLGDAKAAANEYLDWCRENGYTPKFDQFADHENYYKLLEDYSCYDKDGVTNSPMGAVEMRFPTDSDAFGSMKDLIADGLEEDAILQAKQEKAVPEIIKQIQSVLPEFEGTVRERNKGKKKAAKMSDREAQWTGIEDKAAEHFGTTNDFRSAGYMLPDGRLLDFSGKHWGGKNLQGKRTVDHMDISEVVEEYDENYPLAASSLGFMKRGNIRMVPESSGIELFTGAEPTAQQYDKLRDYLDAIRNDPSAYGGKYFYVDFVENRSGKKEGLRYVGVPNTERAINDIKHFYQTGEVRGPGLSAFYGDVRYSAREEIRKMDIPWDPDEKSTIKTQLNRARSRLMKQPPVKSVTYDAKKNDYLEQLDKVLRENFGYKIARQDGISFLFDKGAVSILDKYIHTDGERAAAIAAPYVLKRGEIISGHKYHKGGLYPSLTFGASVEINGEKGVEAVTVLFGDKDRVHALRIVDDNGRDFELPLIKEEATPSPVDSGVKAPVAVPIGVTSKDRLTQDDGAVKKSDRENLGYHAGDLGKAETVKYQERDNEKTDRELLLDTDGATLTAAEKVELQKYRAKAEDFETSQQKVQAALEVLDTMARTHDPNVQKQRAKVSNLQAGMQKALRELTAAERNKTMLEIIRKEREIQRRRTSYATRETFTRRDLRNRITRLYNDLNRRITSPSEKKNIPVPVMEQAIDVLQAINMDSSREGSKAGEKLRQKLLDLRAKYEQLQNDPDFRNAAAYDPIVDELLKNMVDTVGDTPINKMSSAQMLAVYNALTALDKTARKALKIKMLGEERDAYQVAKQMSGETQSVKKPHKNLLAAWLNTQLSPERMFNRLGGYHKDSAWSQVYRMLNEGQLTATQIQMEGTMIFDGLLDGKDFEKMINPKETVDIGLKDANGKTILITRGMMLSLYMHLQNEQNAKHIAHGGLMVPNLRDYYNGKNNRGMDSSLHAVGVSQEIGELKDRLHEATTDAERADIRRQIAEAEDSAAEYLDGLRRSIENKLTAYDQKWIAAAKELFDVYSKGRLNETTMDVYGIKRANVENYFPIWVSGDFLNTPFESIAKDMSLENAGFMKERVDSGKPMRLADISDVSSNQIRKVAQYCGLMPATRNFQKIWGKVETGYRSSLQNEVRQKFGQNGIDYIENLMADLNGARRGKEGALADFFNAVAVEFEGDIPNV